MSLLKSCLRSLCYRSGVGGAGTRAGLRLTGALGCASSGVATGTIGSGTGYGGVRLGTLRDGCLIQGRGCWYLMRLCLLRRNERGLMAGTLGAGARVSRRQVGAGNIVAAASVARPMA